MTTNSWRDKPCIQWAGSVDPKGYGIRVERDPSSPRGWRNFRAHRFSWIQVNGPIPTGMFVCHHCDNPGCTEVSHLFLGTAKDNYHDMRSKGREYRLTDKDRKTTKLTEPEVVQMRALSKTRGSWAKLGKMFGVSGSGARQAVLGLTWKKVAL